MKKKVVIALSGGVDSSVAAYLLQEQGYDVVGVMLQLEPPRCKNRCCEIELAEQVAKKLGIPFYVFNVEKQFKKHVINYFIAELEAGRTPNPCVPCNYWIKFGVFLDLIRSELGINLLATGHYAKVQQKRTLRVSMGFPSNNNRYENCIKQTRRVGLQYRLLKSRDGAKDQTYFLHTLTQKQLSRLIFPLGEIGSKDKVRQIAKKIGLPTRDVAESQDICFQMPEILSKPGVIKDIKGRKLGGHKGLPYYTIGQREGLGVAIGEPLYVVEKKQKTNEIIVGCKKDLEKSEIKISDINIISGNYTPRTFKATVKIRYQAKDVPATITLKNDKSATVRLKTPVLSPTPGQFAVFYNGDEVLGGGIIRL